MNSDGIIEIPGMILLFACLLRCTQYFVKSHVKQVKAFWLAAVLIFVAVIRRELNYLPDLLVPSDFLLLGQSYDWWEDSILTIIYLVALGLLAYARHYLWAVLKTCQFHSILVLLYWQSCNTWVRTPLYSRIHLVKLSKSCLKLQSTVLP